MWGKVIATEWGCEVGCPLDELLSKCLQLLLCLSSAAQPPTQPKQKLRAPVPLRSEPPVYGLSSNKNFITHNAVDVILAKPKKASGLHHMLLEAVLCTAYPARAPKCHGSFDSAFCLHVPTGASGGLPMDHQARLWQRAHVSA